MLDEITTIRRRFTRHGTLDECIDEAFVALSGLGYDALVYDYTPIPYDLDGAIMIPSMLKLRNIDDDMRDYWCDRGYFRIDPVQIVAARSSTPFAWSYDKEIDTEIGALLDETTEPVARYLRERDLTSGVTIPIHMPRGGYATVTGIRFGADEMVDRDAGTIARFSLAGAYLPRHGLRPLRPIGSQSAPAVLDRARARVSPPFGTWPLCQGDLARHRALDSHGRHAPHGRRQEAGRQEPHAGRRSRRAFPPARQLTERPYHFS